MFQIIYTFEKKYMSKQEWDSRFRTEEYIYGVNPNNFLKKCLLGLKPGRILFPAEGEGRNVVYAAGLGWDTFAFDQSETGRDKALQLAEKNKVTIHYDLYSLEEWEVKAELYDCISLIFVHLPKELRVKVHQSVISALKPGGILIFEAFTKDQMPRTSGGPKNLDLLFDPDDIRKDFEQMEFLNFEVVQVELDEGPLHKGIADVVHFMARKGV
jgi:SAM-dependent methyltransferase